ncbi:lytic murein transglycosylase, partial [Sulfitobacter sp. HI0054]|uniref:lytic murein transglycosylase n=2 Tax=Sulfitobacter TaxID=60136 RepID=UPI000A936942
MIRHYAMISGILATAGMGAPAFGSGPTESLRPAPRAPQAVLAAVAPVAQEPAAEAGGGDAGLRAWVKDFRPRALQQGIDPDVFDRALDTVSYDPEVIRRDRNQSEFTKTIWDYLDTATSDLRVQNGQKALAQWQRTLEEIEAEYGVEKEIVTAIWGLESAYGSFRGGDRVLDSLATLAYDARRAEFFEGELFD